MFRFKRLSDDAVLSTIDYALRSVKVAAPKPRRLIDSERDALSRAVLAHMKLCGWTVWHDPPPRHSTYGGSSKPRDP